MFESISLVITAKGATANADMSNETQITTEATTEVVETTEIEIASETTTKATTAEITTTTSYVTVAPTFASVTSEVSYETVTPIQFDDYFSEDDVVMMAQLIHAEAGGVFPYNRRAAVAWTVLNRLDNGHWGPTTIRGIITQPDQYAWYEGCIYTEKDYEIARDVLERWATEKFSGEVDEGRILARNFESFYGDGNQNYFYDENGNYWDFNVSYDPYAC